jgi:Xaa-Pro aminopeptidase
MKIYKERRAKLLSKLREKEIDGFITLNFESSDAANIYYLSGFRGSTAVLIIAEEESFFTDSRYIEQVQNEVKGIPLHQVKGKYLDDVAAAVTKTKITRLGINSNCTSYSLVENLRGKLPTIELVPLKEEVEQLRRCKDKEEITRIRNAIRLTESSLEKILTQITPGMTEAEIALELEVIMRKAGAEKVAFDLIVAAGENSALPHYRAGNRKVKRGDLLLFDIGVRAGGYCSDITRVFAVGKVTAKAQEIYDIVLTANRAGLAAAAAGKHGKEIDKQARDVIDVAGYKDHFGHGLGHGFGIEVHEQPRLSLLSEDILEEGMVVTIEPGIYLSGFGGVRIEDDILIHADGCEVLTSFPKGELRVL